MTVIAAIKDNNSNCVWIGSDKLETFGNNKLPILEGKWVVNGSWAIGITGCRKTINIVKNSWNVIKKNIGIYKIVENLKNELVSHQLKPKCDDRDYPDYGESFIITDGNQIWTVYGDFSIAERPDNFLHARGSGANFAMAASYALMKAVPKTPKKDILNASILTAIEFDAGSGLGVWMDSVKSTNNK